MAGGGKGGGKTGGGHASNAALHDDEDLMNRTFRSWASRRKRKKAVRGSLVNYDKSPMPPKRTM